MPSQADKRVAVITGGTSGIGLAVASELNAAGVAVVLAGRDEERGKNATRALARDGDAQFIRTNVRHEADVAALFEGALRRFGRVDFIFNNAGAEGAGVAPPADWSDTACDEVLLVNIKGAFLAIKHGVPALLDSGGGTIVNTASFVGTVVPILEAAVYGASKAAVISLTRAVAAGYEDKNIRCYAVCPWVTDTPMIDRLTGGGGTEAKAGLAATFNPSGKLVTTREIAEIVRDMFLERDLYANGDVVLVDGGGKAQRIQPFTLV
jgi:NAD(P)-dependent dehydrogenase (short-subunit alcohol dehydrogenase family)